MVRSTDQKTTAIEKIVFILRSKQKGECHYDGTWRSTKINQEAEEATGKCSKNLNFGFHAKEQAKLGKEV